MKQFESIELKTVLSKQELVKTLEKRGFNVIESLLDDKYIGEPLRKYLYLTYLPELVASPTDELNRFYGRYYWMLTLTKHYKQRFGRDDGLEQQTFKVLEQSESLNSEVDWGVIEEIDKEVLNTATIVEIV